jgi:hypothetical protein
MTEHLVPLLWDFVVVHWKEEEKKKNKTKMRVKKEDILSPQLCGLCHTERLFILGDEPWPIISHAGFVLIVRTAYLAFPLARGGRLKAKMELHLEQKPGKAVWVPGIQDMVQGHTVNSCSIGAS